MEILPFDKTNGTYVAKAAALLAKAFPQAYATSADEEMAEILSAERVTIMAVEDGHQVGLVGAMPQYEKTGWELHPLAVCEEAQNRGIGTALMKALESKVADLGGITIYLGTDDESDRTSLSGADLYEDTFGKITRIRNLNRHPYEFYQKVGYRIVGVIPDANGIGKPDIIMAKKIGKGQ